MIQINKLPVVILQAARESMGVRFDEESKDNKIEELYPAQLLLAYVKNQRLTIEDNYSRIFQAAVDINNATTKPL